MARQVQRGGFRGFRRALGRQSRVDTFGYAGFRPSLNFDSLLAKVVGHASEGGLEAAMRRTARALGDFRIVGVDTNIPFLQALLAHRDVRAWKVHTRFVDERMEELVAARPGEGRFFPARIRPTGREAGATGRSERPPRSSLRQAAAAAGRAGPSPALAERGSRSRREQGTIVSTEPKSVRGGPDVGSHGVQKMEQESGPGRRNLTEVTVRVRSVYEGYPGGDRRGEIESPAGALRLWIGTTRLLGRVHAVRVYLTLPSVRWRSAQDRPKELLARTSRTCRRGTFVETFSLALHAELAWPRTR